MKKISYAAAIAAMLSVSSTFVSAQSFKDTFDSNSLEWTECAYENNSGKAIIDKGFLNIESKGENKALGAFIGEQVGQNTSFKTHCYAPIDVMKPFKVRTNVTIQKLAVDRITGLIFNYKDDGNFYTFTFNNEMVSFLRFENYALVGKIEQGIKWAKKSKLDQQWELVSDGNELTFFVDGMQVIKVKYMPLSYSGIGFYTFGKQELKVDDIEFIQ